MKLSPEMAKRITSTKQIIAEIKARSKTHTHEPLTTEERWVVGVNSSLAWWFVLAAFIPSLNLPISGALKDISLWWFLIIAPVALFGSIAAFFWFALSLQNLPSASKKFPLWLCVLIFSPLWIAFFSLLIGGAGME